MTSKFAQNVIKELNAFRLNPKSIQHQCELIRKGLSRLKGDDPFLKEIDSFVKSLNTIKPLAQLRLNDALTEAAKKELPNFRGRDNYIKYKRANSLKGIVPDIYLDANPALVADDGADEPINVVTKIVLNKLDKSKEGRSILLDPHFTQVGIAHEVFDEENMVILILATKFVDDKPIKSTKHEFIMNIQYHETKDIKKPKLQAFVHHKIKGDIFGDDNFEKTTYEKQIYSQGGSRPKIEQKTGGLKTNKSEIRMVTKTSTRQNPYSGTAKNEKVEETSMRRRNEGITKKTETKTTKTVTKTSEGGSSTTRQRFKRGGF